MEESGYEGLYYCHEWFVDNHRHVISADHGSSIYFFKNDPIHMNIGIDIYFSSADIGNGYMQSPISSNLRLMLEI